MPWTRTGPAATATSSADNLGIGVFNTTARNSLNNRSMIEKKIFFKKTKDLKFKNNYQIVDHRTISYQNQALYRPTIKHIEQLKHTKTRSSGCSTCNFGDRRFPSRHSTPEARLSSADVWPLMLGKPSNVPVHKSCGLFVHQSEIELNFNIFFWFYFDWTEEIHDIIVGHWTQFETVHWSNLRFSFAMRLK